jgi:hypothetical protein
VDVGHGDFDSLGSLVAVGFVGGIGCFAGFRTTDVKYDGEVAGFLLFK